ncbi:MAG: tRNA uridine-5-carboxymethylaminomethyl(34) synthesis enzyme MnmG [Bacilli bacterium]
MFDYDVIVVGGGHAGLEAAFCSAHKGHKTLLITLNFKKVGNMPCNPSIGGSAKGIVVREIDCLGGMMGKIADKHYLQMKMLNTGKGPGVQCLRSQQDKIIYPSLMQEEVKNTKNLDYIEDEVIDLLHDDNHVFGVVTRKGKSITSLAVILTTGTYMNALTFKGKEVIQEGPEGEKASIGLSSCLENMGISLIRLKTGTPPRIKKESIDFSKALPQPGSEGKYAFSYETKEFLPLEKQELCYLIYTTSETHRIIREHLDDTALYGGLVKGVGPRYCPSIESKIVNFKDKERHQLFLEPESIETNSIYIQGFATSMSKEIQELMVRSLPGFEHAEFLKYAYAIEYDAIRCEEYDETLQIKKWPGLYIGGQICGTSGYEEAASLGLLAGINACLKIENKEPLVLTRNESYIGVMIDDLVTKGTNEPYRLLSSRAEYRLLLRHDNADLRLTEIGHNVGLINEDRYNSFLEKKKHINEAIEIINSLHVGIKSPANEYLLSLNYEPLKGGLLVSELVKRQGIKLKELINYIEELKSLNLTDEEIEEIEIMVKYEGYISKQEKDALNMLKLEKLKLSKDIDYLSLDGLALEARSKLNEIKPSTIGQASRISGVNPSDISNLIFYVKKGH